jgi:hypothetical protein
VEGRYVSLSSCAAVIQDSDVAGLTQIESLVNYRDSLGFRESQGESVYSRGWYSFERILRDSHSFDLPVSRPPMRSKNNLQQQDRAQVKQEQEQEQEQQQQGQVKTWRSQRYHEILAGIDPGFSSQTVDRWQ